MELLTRAEIFKIIGWIIAIIVPIILYRWNSKELKESEKKQEKRTDDLWKKLQKEVVDRKDFEKSIAEVDAKSWKSLYLSGEKKRKKEWEYFEERLKQYEKLLEKERKEKDKLRLVNMNLRRQLRRKGVPDEEHEIDDDERRQEVIREVRAGWRFYSKNGKINGKTITEVLWKNWEKVFDSKEGDDIIKERDRLIDIIIETSKKK